MKQKTPVAIEVYYSNQVLLFGFILHLTENGYYKLEITYPELKQLKNNQYKINFCESPNEKGLFYIGWPKLIPTLEMALEILKVWSVATSYTLFFGLDSRSFFTNKELFKCRLVNFLENFAKHYKIVAQIVIPKIKSKKD